MHILADIGGTKMRLAATVDRQVFTEPLILTTPQGYDEALALLCRSIHDLSRGEAMEKIVIGLPVLLSRDKRSIEDAKNIPEWKDRSFAQDIEESLKTRVHLENDVALVALGEAVHGAGKGSKKIVYLTVSTGVNAALVRDGFIDQEYRGVSTGSQYVEMGDLPITWEDMISGKSIAKRYSKQPKEIAKDDPIWEKLARITAFGLHNTIAHWTPDRVVLGGSMFNTVGISVERVIWHLSALATEGRDRPEVVHSQLGDVGGLWGGLALSNQDA